MSNWESAFKKSLAEHKAGKVKAHVYLCFAPEVGRALRQVGRLGDGPANWGRGCEHLAAFEAAGNLSWQGAAAWLAPESFDQELRDAGCGMLLGCRPDEADPEGPYVKILGPRGIEESSSSPRMGSYVDNDFGMLLALNKIELRNGSGVPAGRPRPSYWPEPLPLVESPWSCKDGPSAALDWSQAMLLYAQGARRSLQRIICEEFKLDACPPELCDLMADIVPLRDPLALAALCADDDGWGHTFDAKEEKIIADALAGAKAMALRARLESEALPAQGLSAGSLRI